MYNQKDNWCDSLALSGKIEGKRLWGNSWSFKLDGLAVII